MRKSHTHTNKIHRNAGGFHVVWSTWRPFFIVAIFLRLIITTLPPYAIDMGGYVAWSQYLATVGPIGFYERFHVVYAPFYQYFLWISGEIAAIFHLEISAHIWLIKMWSVMADICGGYLIIHIGEKILTKEKNHNDKKNTMIQNYPTRQKILIPQAKQSNTINVKISDHINVKYRRKNLILQKFQLTQEKSKKPLTMHTILALSMFYILNPAVLFNSSVWGQFDGIPALLLTLSLYFFIEKKPVGAAFIFLLSVLTKPQSALLLPIIVFLFIVSTQQYKHNPFRLISIWIRTILGGLSIYLVIIMPFYDPTPLLSKISKWLDPFYWIFHLYLQSVQDYPYATANAFNLWFLLNKQIIPDHTLFLGLSLAMWGIFLFACCTAFAIWILLRGNFNDTHVFISSWLTLLSAFLFMTKMHERYLVPALLIGIVCVLYENRLLIPYIMCSAGTFINQWVLYNLSFDSQYWLPANHFLAKLCSLFMLLTFGWTVKMLIMVNHAETKITKSI